MKMPGGSCTLRGKLEGEVHSDCIFARKKSADPKTSRGRPPDPRRGPDKENPGPQPLPGKNQFLEPPWEGATWLKCVRVVKYHTFQGWPWGHQIVSKMIPKSSLLGATLAPKLTKMPSKRGTKKTSKNRRPQNTKMIKK